jgi:YqaJ-like viral recombinase domain
MIIVPLEQGTPEWLEYRKAHGMASETPSLLGSSLYYPFTPFQLWLTKKGLSEVPHHPGMTQGLAFEAFARAQFAREYAVPEVKPRVVEEDTHLLAASLDGYWEDLACPGAGPPGVLEIKFWSNTATLPALLADVWPAHYDQVQHQLAVTELEEACLMYGNKERQTYIWVPADEARQTAIRQAWARFWPYLEGQESPALTEQDYDEGVSTDAEFRALERAYVRFYAQLESARLSLEACRQQLIAFADGRNVRGREVMVCQSWRASLDMAALRAEVDIARYRRVPRLVTSVRRVGPG